MKEDSFYESVPAFADFDQVVEKRHFHPLPGDWLVGVADVVDSTGAIAAGRYKVVNTAGASVIAAVMNALGGAAFPFVFGGDGAGFAVPQAWRGPAEAALSACRRWAGEELDLSLRAAFVPVADIRQAGPEVAVAKFQPSPGVTYAMFSGGGVAWAEARMKAGDYEVSIAQPGTRPDLTGLSCRFAPIAACNGEILSLLLLPDDGADPPTFDALVAEILHLVEDSAGRGGHPIRAEGPHFVWPPQGLDQEVRNVPAGLARLKRRFAVLGEQLVPWLLQTFGGRAAGFDPVVYRRDLAANTDFRKFDDGLKLTVDCPSATIAAIEARLVRARNEGIAHYGLHRQDSALMTCIVPSPFTDTHMHFVDGAAGGYARAAEALKASMARR